LRADARRNTERIVEAATAVFGEDGAGASFEEIARRAGVGSATLYRRFPTRSALFEAVYEEQVQQLVASLPENLTPQGALEEWFRRFVRFITGKRAFAEEMAHDTELVREARARIYAIADPLVHAGHEGGFVQPDITADDVLRMFSGVGLADYPRAGQRDRVIEICLRGLRP
jgi:AcrR family transcriptional regulator